MGAILGSSSLREISYANIVFRIKTFSICRREYKKNEVKNFKWIKLYRYPFLEGWGKGMRKGDENNFH